MYVCIWIRRGRIVEVPTKNRLFFCSFSAFPQNTKNIIKDKENVVVKDTTWKHVIFVIWKSSRAEQNVGRWHDFSGFAARFPLHEIFWLHTLLREDGFLNARSCYVSLDQFFYKTFRHEMHNFLGRYVWNISKYFFLASQDALEVMLVSESVSDSKNRVDWCDPGEWRYLLKTLLMRLW